ncbi:hypothetical protein ACF0H5_004902 [Mactra antiquata]
MEREYTWVRPVEKGQNVIQLKAIRDKNSRQSKQYKATPAEKFETFDYTNDAIFESFRDYPRKKQLYRKHKDIAKDYEREVKFYRSCQRWYSIESNRQIHNVKDRFRKLLKHTFNTTAHKSHKLINSYNLWLPARINPTSAKTTNRDPENQDRTNNETVREDTEIPSPTPSIKIEQSLNDRIHSFRSLSVDNIPAVDDKYRPGGLAVKQLTLHEKMATSCSNLAHTST